MNADSTLGRWKRARPWLGVYLVTMAVVAVVAGIVWNRVTTLPSYVIGQDYRAQMPESGLTEIIAPDVYFTLIGAIAGLILGLTSWLLFRGLGWPVTLIAGVGAVLAGLAALWVGEFIGPRNLQDRIAAANIGEAVRVDFTAHTWVPLAIWVACAVLAVFVAALVKKPDWISHVPDTNQASESAGDHRVE